LTYARIGSIQKVGCENLLEIFKGLEYKESKGPGVHYRTIQNVVSSIVDVKALHVIWPTDAWHNAMFICIPPKGKIPLHTESIGISEGDKGPWKKYHIPLQTSDKAISYIGAEQHNLEVGSVYEIDFKKAHESVNNGSEDRVHLVMEIYE